MSLATISHIENTVTETTSTSSQMLNFSKELAETSTSVSKKKEVHKSGSRRKRQMDDEKIRKLKRKNKQKYKKEEGNKQSNNKKFNIEESTVSTIGQPVLKNPEVKKEELKAIAGMISKKIKIKKYKLCVLLLFYVLSTF